MLILFFLVILIPVGAENGFRIMTLNIWTDGNNIKDGLSKISKHVEIVNPDILVLQEIHSDDTALSIINGLSHPKDWSHFFPDGYDTAIITKHQILKTSTDGSEAAYAYIELSSELRVHVWSVHAEYRAYGPYAACNKMVKNLSVILDGEAAPYGVRGRVDNVRTLLASKEMQDALKTMSSEPLIVAGDFNSPSHLDWIESTKHTHCGWVIEWPVTKMMEDSNFTDSFREVHPDPLKKPCRTWSSVTKGVYEWNYEVPEPQDRIDFIFYQGPIKANNSDKYGGAEPILPSPNYADNDWPTDHYAVFTDFILDSTELFKASELNYSNRTFQ